MSKVSDALDALRAAQALLDELEEWAAAGHVSMASSLLYDAFDDALSLAHVGHAPASPRLPDHYVAPLDAQAELSAAG
jgi:hypothetical protein